MNFLQGIGVLVLGLGESGLAMARWCARCGATVRVWDSREAAPNRDALERHLPQAMLLTGALDDAAFDGVRLVLRSPGLAPGDQRIAAPLGRAAERGVLVQGELELFAHALADLKRERGYSPKLLAVTGTNGKTTTAAMTGLLIERAGRRVAVAGNIGPTMLQTLSDALDLEPVPQEGGAGENGGSDEPRPWQVAPTAASVSDDAPAPAEGRSGGVDDAEDAKDQIARPSEADIDEIDAADAPEEAGEESPEHDDSLAAPANAAGPVVLSPPAAPAAPVFEHLPEVWVLELSSFQLDEAKGFEPDAAVVLNISEDHLDWHGSMPAYVAAKARVFGKNAVMIINRDDPQVERMVPEPQAPQATSRTAGKARAARPVEREVLRFGLDAPQRPGDYGLVVENGMAWLVRAREADPTIKRGRGAKAAAEDEELHLQRLMPADALRVRGRHNAANALAALALAGAIGCPLAPMLHGLRDYRGEPHRVEYVGVIDGVEAFDDSKGTNVGATVAALNGLAADKAPARLLVILGGDGKGQDFAPLADPVQRHVRAVAT
ncbi:MAG: Mur ligase family protein, partial [Rhizobacter sp.]|nr:Mur ligase family protein [Rhizobacter sp.]